MKSLNRSFILIIFFYTFSVQANPLCSQFLFNSEKKESPISNRNKASDTHGHSATILFQIYEIAKRSNVFDNKKQQKKFEEDLKKVSEFLDRSPTHKEQLTLNKLDYPIENYIKKALEIITFFESLQKSDALIFRKTIQAILAVFTKHIPTVLEEDSIDKIDWPRMNLILKTIADFDNQKPKFSIYKIKRSIEGRYSLREFILCRR